MKPRSSAHRLASVVQSITVDELGGKALFRDCLELVRSSRRAEGASREEHACAIVEANRERLLASVAERRKRDSKGARAA